MTADVIQGTPGDADYGDGDRDRRCLALAIAGLPMPGGVAKVMPLEVAWFMGSYRDFYDFLLGIMITQNCRNIMEMCDLAMNTWILVEFKPPMTELGTVPNESKKESFALIGRSQGNLAGELLTNQGIQSKKT